MSALRGRPTDAVCGIDAELMRFDEPLIDGAKLRKHQSNRHHQPLPYRSIHNLGCYWLEPTLEAAVKCVVGRRLPVRPVRRQGELLPFLNEAGMPAEPVPPAIAQILVSRQGAPPLGERAQLSDVELQHGP